MSIFSEIKKLFQKEQTTQIEFSNLNSWLKSNKEKNKKTQEEIIKEIFNIKNQHLEELNEQIKILREINIDEIKAEDKIRFIVKENLQYYLNHLNQLIENLREIEEDRVNQLIDEIISSINEFDKKSKLNYEKSTFLIGKELGKSREIISRLINDLKKNQSSYENPINKIRIINQIELILKQRQKIKKEKFRYESEIEENKKQILNLNKKIESKNLNITKIKESQEFKEQEKLKKEKEILKNNLKKELFRLKSLTDFKQLTNFYHSFKKEMEQINRFKENFISEYNNNSETLLKLIKESKIDNEQIQKKIDEISQIKQNLESIKTTSNNIPEMQKEINELNERIKELENKNNKFTNKLEKTESELNENKSDIKNKLKEIDIELV